MAISSAHTFIEMLFCRQYTLSEDVPLSLQLFFCNNFRVFPGLRGSNINIPAGKRNITRQIPESLSDIRYLSCRSIILLKQNDYLSTHDMTCIHSLTVFLLAKRIVLKLNIIYLSVAMFYIILRGLIISFKFRYILTCIFGK